MGVAGKGEADDERRRQSPGKETPWLQTGAGHTYEAVGPVYAESTLTRGKYCVKKETVLQARL